MVRNWRVVSSTRLLSNTLELLKLKKSSPYKIVHPALDNFGKQIVLGSGVLKVAPREYGNKYIPQATCGRRVATVVEPA